MDVCHLRIDGSILHTRGLCRSSKQQHASTRVLVTSRQSSRVAAAASTRPAAGVRSTVHRRSSVLLHQSSWAARAAARGRSTSPMTPSASKAAEVAVGEDLPATYGDPFSRPSKGRRSGIILHPTSLPGPYGIGELGQEALNFVNWLAESGCSIWQVLPMVPPDKYGSPYSSTDALCGNTMLVAIDELVAEGLLDEADKPPAVAGGEVDYIKVAEAKAPLLTKAADRLLDDPAFKRLRQQLDAFRAENAWIEDSALFDVLSALPEHDDLSWWEWEEPLRLRDAAALAKAREQHAREVDRFVAKQFLFDRQWRVVKEYANKKDVLIVGDMPIYVGGHSSDVWANQGLFSLSETGEPVLVSGVPPDAFSETGQLWGSPLYDWPAHAAQGYAWWAQRLGRAFALYDEVRIDHFRGFAGYWAVEAWRETAMIGTWKRGPGVDLFKALEKALGGVPILAEDLGVITPDVDSLREEIKAPGMLILQFAWGGGSANLYLPHNHYENAFVYSGTHDNETTRGWWLDTADDKTRAQVMAYYGLSPEQAPAAAAAAASSSGKAGKASGGASGKAKAGAAAAREGDGVDIAWLFIRSAFASVAKTAVVPMQDVMDLDNSARMNTPGKAVGNWGWRLPDAGVWAALAPEAQRLRALNKAYDRLVKVENPKPRAVEPELVDSTEGEGHAPAAAADKANGSSSSSSGAAAAAPARKKAAGKPVEKLAEKPKKK